MGFGSEPSRKNFGPEFGEFGFRDSESFNSSLKFFGLEFGAFGVRDPESTQKFQGAFHSQLEDQKRQVGSEAIPDVSWPRTRE